MAEESLGNVASMQISNALSVQNAVSHQQAMNAVQVAASGAVVKGLVELDPSQAASMIKSLSGNDVAGNISALLAALGGGQVGNKAAGTTPPATV